MKALVLCGGIPQIALMEYLKSKGITVILADMNEKVAGRKYADIFYPVSVLDKEAVKEVAIKENVDFLITVCADQVLEVVAIISEELGLPCYIDATTATKVSKKSYMKKIFCENDVPTSKHVILGELDFDKIKDLTFPIIVKPVDSYSSRGVKKVLNNAELETAFYEAKNISREGNVVVEEFVEGEEVTVDVYVENGIAKVLTTSISDKVKGEGFVIHRTRNPANISKEIYEKIEDTAQRIATGFNLKDSPMLIQLITDGKRISVIEFCARTGGGIKFRLIKRVSGFDVVKAVADLTLGEKPHYEDNGESRPFIINEFLYAKEGVIDHLEGFEELLEEGVIDEYYQLKASGTKVGSMKCSGDRIACFTIQTNDIKTLKEKHGIANMRIKAISVTGEDLIRHDLVANLSEKGI